MPPNVTRFWPISVRQAAREPRTPSSETGMASHLRSAGSIASMTNTTRIVPVSTSSGAMAW